MTKNGTQHTALQIDGMNCALCVGRVEKSLRVIPGVLSVEVNLTTARTLVIGQALESHTLLSATKAAGWSRCWTQKRTSLQYLSVSIHHSGRRDGCCALFAPSNAYVRRMDWFLSNMDLLGVLGASAAYGLSFSHLLSGDTEQPLYFETPALIITLVLLGKWLENRAKQQITAAIRARSSFTPNSQSSTATDRQ